MNEKHLENFNLALVTKQVIDKKNNLNYVTWANAWEQFKKVYPYAIYEVVKFDGLPYQASSRGFMVYTRVTADGITYEMWLPVMDYSNKIIKEPDLMQINKTIMRCLTKNLAMFGIGLYVYAGEDLPDSADNHTSNTSTPDQQAKAIVKNVDKIPAPKELKSADVVAETKPKDIKEQLDILQELLPILDIIGDKVFDTEHTNTKIDALRKDLRDRLHLNEDLH